MSPTTASEHECPVLKEMFTYSNVVKTPFLGFPLKCCYCTFYILVYHPTEASVIQAICFKDLSMPPKNHLAPWVELIGCLSVSFLQSVRRLSMQTPRQLSDYCYFTVSLKSGRACKSGFCFVRTDLTVPGLCTSRPHRYCRFHS